MRRRNINSTSSLSAPPSSFATPSPAAHSMGLIMLLPVLLREHLLVLELLLLPGAQSLRHLSYV